MSLERDGAQQPRSANQIEAIKTHRRQASPSVESIQIANTAPPNACTRPGHQQHSVVRLCQWAINANLQPITMGPSILSRIAQQPSSLTLHQPTILIIYRTDSNAIAPVIVVPPLVLARDGRPEVRLLGYPLTLPFKPSEHRQFHYILWL